MLQAVLPHQPPHPQRPTHPPAPPPSTATYLRAPSRPVAPRGHGHVPVTSSVAATTRPPLPPRPRRSGLFEAAGTGALGAELLAGSREAGKSFLFLPYMSWRGRPGRGGQRCQGRRGDPLAGGPSRGARRCFYPLRKGRLTIFIFLLNLEISDNAGRLGWGRQRPMWKSLRRRGGEEGRRDGGSEGEESGRGCAWEPGPCRPEKVVWNNSTHLE